MKYLSFAMFLALALMLSSQPSGREHVGQQADGSFLLVTGWRIQPVGTQVPMDTLPMSTALSRDGKFLLVLNGGYRPPSITVLSVPAMSELSRIPIQDGWLGLTFSPDGSLVYTGGGARGTVQELTFSSQGELKPSREFRATADHTTRDFIGDVAVSPDGRMLYAADLFHDSIVAIDARSGNVTARYKTGRRPYRILFHPDGKAFFVSSWADGTVYLHSAADGSDLGRIQLGPHTTDLVLSERKPDHDGDSDAGSGADGDKASADWRYRLFVTAANTNTVFVVGVGENKTLRLIESINVALTPRHPLGMTPSALALSPDQKRLLVVCSDANVVAVADISGPKTVVNGFLPTGWYPTAARILSDGRFLVLNGRGLKSYPNTRGPGPLGAPAIDRSGDPRKQYVAYMQTGTMSVIDPPDDDALEKYTQSAQALSPYRDTQLDPQNLPGSSVIYSTPQKPSPIEHVIYVVKENRTYDQVFGKIGKGNGDPTLALFDESSAPNHFKLAREFVLFDNFYTNADVSADGHNWALAGIASDFVEKIWPTNYANRLRYYGFEGNEPANLPPAGYIWSNALAAGLSVRNYGEWVVNKEKAGPDGVQIAGFGDPSIRPITNVKYRSFDLDYPDVERAGIFLDDLHQFESTGVMPRLMIVRLGNDHTSGTSSGKIAPLSAFADNDAALGMLVEGVSKSRFWPKTAIFVIEDDAQNGPDHVDSHRSVLLALSPYTHRSVIDSTMYNQSSVLRTMELILGMKPLTHYDAGARPMTVAFAAAPQNTPYQAEKPRISLTDRNPARSATAARSARMDFSQADRIDDDELNDILWSAIKGTAPPPPVRSYFSR